MGFIITHLYGNNLIIFRAGDIDNPSTDVIFYIHKENEFFIKLLVEEDKQEKEEGQEVSIEEITKVGKKIITIKQLERLVSKKHKNLTQNIAEETSGGEDLAYKLFGFLLSIKLAIKTIINEAYTKSLVELSQLLVGFEDEIAYNLAQYFLDDLDYKVDFSSDILNKLEDKNQFIYYYKKFKDSLKETKDLTRDVVETAYEIFRAAVGSSKTYKNEK